ncbi:MAG: hypothetical protein WC009_03970 [Methylotenera sp.]
MNKPLDMILDKTRMNQVMVAKKSRLSIRGCLQVAVLGIALSAVLPVQVYAADEDSVAAEPSVLGIAEGERVIEPVTALANPTPVPAKALRNNSVTSKSKTSFPKKPATTAENAIISKLEFKQANMVDVARALADMSGLNIVATEEAAKKYVTVFLQNITVKDALDTISKNSGLWYRQDKISKTYRIMSTDEYQRDMVVYREDTTRVFNVLHPNAIIVATAVRDLYGDRVRLTLGAEDTTVMPSLGGSGSQTSISTTTTSNSNRTRTTRNTTVNRQNNNANNNVNNDDPAGAVKDRLTPEQLQTLGNTLAKYGDVNALSSEALKGITSSEQPIFITLNREHDLIIVRTSDNAAMLEIEKLINQMNRPTQQVLLEMKILSLDVGDSYRQSFDLDYVPNSAQVFGPPTDQDKTPLFTPAPVNATNTQTIGPVGNQTTLTSTGVISSGVKNVLGLGNFALEGGTFVYQFMNDKIRARIQLLQENNRINTLSSPILLATNNKPARVFVGTEQVVTTGFDAIAGGANSVSVGAPAIIPVTEIRNIGNTLQVMPKINADGTVTLLIQQDSSSLLRGASTIPIPVGSNIQSFNVDSVRTSNIQGTVVAKNGLTVAIGGLIDTNDSESEQKVPLLGDIPFIGELFKRKVQSKGKRELILLITPHIIDTPQNGEDLTRDAIEPLSDQEW